MAEEGSRSAALHLGSRRVFECLLEQQAQSVQTLAHDFKGLTHAIAGPALGTRWLAGHGSGNEWCSWPRAPRGNLQCRKGPKARLVVPDWFLIGKPKGSCGTAGGAGGG